MGYMPVIATDNCNPVPPVTNVYNIYNTGTNVPDDTSTGYRPPSGWCGTVNEWIYLNENIRREYDNVLLIDDSHYTHPTYPTPKEEIHHPIKITDCPKCNSNLPLRQTDDKGICKCEFCGKEVYVW